MCEDKSFVHQRLIEWRLEEYIDAFDRKYCLVCFFNILSVNKIIACLDKWEL